MTVSVFKKAIHLVNFARVEKLTKKIMVLILIQYSVSKKIFVECQRFQRKENKNTTTKILF